jgi:hypothetical protein
MLAAHLFVEAREDLFETLDLSACLFQVRFERCL